MIERKIVIGLITSTEYCSQIKPIWNPILIDSPTAKRMAGWCWEYFDKYGKAPGKEIQAIYYSKIKAPNFPKVIAEEIEQDILPSLSKEVVEEDFNITFWVDETKKHFDEQHLKIFTGNIQALLAESQIEDAVKMVSEFKPLNATTVKLSSFIRTIDRIKKEKRPAPTTFMKPWLKAGQLNIIYGSFGSGKSLLCILIAYMLGLKNPDDYEIGEWMVKHSTGTLYIDGELGELEMAERVDQFKWMGQQENKWKLRVFSVPEYQLATEDSFYLSNRINQLKILTWLKEHPEYKLIILDSASTLFGLENENDNSEWNNKINPFLRDLRALGVACILLHHAGKDGKKGLRGASAMGAMAHNIYRLINHGDQRISEGEAWFKLTLEKQRAAGKGFSPFSLHFMQTDDKTQTHWEIT